MGMIKIKEMRLSESSLSSFEYLPKNPNNSVHTIQVKFAGKYINFNFKEKKEAEEVIEYLQNKLPNFLRIKERRWLKSSCIKRYEVMPDFFKIKINGEDEAIRINDPEKFKEMVEFLDNSFL